MASKSRSFRQAETLYWPSRRQFFALRQSNKTVHSASSLPKRPEPPDSSRRAPLRHTHSPAYGCFLPDLTRFTGARCGGPNAQHPPSEQVGSSGDDPQRSPQSRSSGLRVLPGLQRIRVPLTPHLARPIYNKGLLSYPLQGMDFRLCKVPCYLLGIRERPANRSHMQTIFEA